MKKKVKGYFTILRNLIKLETNRRGDYLDFWTDGPKWSGIFIAANVYWSQFICSKFFFVSIFSNIYSVFSS